MALNASVHIETARQAGQTIVKTTFAQPPFKIANITEGNRQKELTLMLMNSSPGVLDDDAYNLRIDVGEYTSLKLQTQSYQRLFQMENGASQNMMVHLQKGSSFTYLPHPCVPHRHSIFHSRNKIYLSKDCALLWGEVVSCGRKLNNEIFEFTSYHSCTEIFLNQKLVVKENLLMRPAYTNPGGIGQLEGHTHQATLLYLDEAADIHTLIESLSKDSVAEDVVFGISSLPVNGLVIRLMGHGAEQLFTLVQQLSLRIQLWQDSVAEKPVAYVA